MKSPQDDKLVKELYEKLNWFTFQAEEEDFDEGQIRAILQLLDTLDPIDFEGVEKECAHSREHRFGIQKGAGHSAAKGKIYRVGKAEKLPKQSSADDADGAFERFQKKYAVTAADIKKKDRAKIIPFTGLEEVSEELAPDMEKRLAMDEFRPGRETEADENTETGKNTEVGKNTDCFRDRQKDGSIKNGKIRRFWYTAGGRAAIAFLTVFTALAATGICTGAVQQKPFFEVVRDGVNGMKITVTGNEMESRPGLVMESSDKVYYESWDEIKEENPEVVVPGYIPEGLELVELYGEDFGNYIRYYGEYEDNEGNELLIHIRYFIEGYVENNIENELEYMESESGVLYYLEPTGYRGYKEIGKCSCSVYFDNLEKLEKIVDTIG